jgi:hypothetical protein
MDFSDLSYYKPGAALSPAFDISQVCFTDGAVIIAEGCAHGRHDYPIMYFQGSNLDGRQ